MAPGDVTRSANRTFELLGAIVEHGGLTLGDAAKATDLATSTALRLIRSLEQTEFVVRGEDNVYRVGPRLLQIGARALGDNQLLPRARLAMKAIAETTRESTYLSTMGPKDTALYLDQIEGTHAIRHMGWVGQSVPLDGTAVGAALSGKVGESGYAIAHDTIEDHSTGVAAPIYNADRSDSRSAQRRRPDIPSDGRGLRQPRPRLGGALRTVVRGTRQPGSLTTPSAWRFSLVSETMWVPHSLLRPTCKDTPHEHEPREIR